MTKSLLPKARLSEGLRRFRDASDGVAAVEAALVIPVMLVVLAITVIWAQAFDIQRKVTQTSRMVTDLVAQYSGTGGAMTKAYLDGLLGAAYGTMEPYSNTGPANVGMVVTQLKADSGGVNGTVVWSEGYQATARTVGSTMALPSGAVAANAYVLLGEATYAYTPLNVGAQAVTTMKLHDSIYLSPRVLTCIKTYAYAVC